VSSIYRLICLSHNPGIPLDTEWHSGQDGRAVAESTLTTLKEMPQNWGEGDDELLEHANCDIVIGSYSYPLVEVGWHPTGGRWDYVKWIDVQWLRTLAHLYHVIADPNINVSRDSPVEFTWGADLTFWSPERVDRLRGELRFSPHIVSDAVS
jgi:hypothetical protein